MSSAQARSTLFLGVYDGPILKEEAEETTLEECAAAWADAQPSAVCPCRTTCGPKCGTTIPYLMLGFLHAFGTESGQKVHIWCLDFCTMLGTSLAQDVYILCLEFCIVAATNQDIRTTSYFAIRHAIIARFLLCLENDLHSKVRNVTHKVTSALHKNICQEIFSCAQWWWATRLMRHHGITHSWATRQIFFGELISVKKARKFENTKWLHKNYCGNIAMTLWKVCLDFCTVSGAYLGQRAY